MRTVWYVSLHTYSVRPGSFPNMSRGKLAQVIRYVLVSLIFDQHANYGHIDEYGADHLCYICCLLVYLLFCCFTSHFSMMVKGVLQPALTARSEERRECR